MASLIGSATLHRPPHSHSHNLLFHDSKHRRVQLSTNVVARKPIRRDSLVIRAADSTGTDVTSFWEDQTGTDTFSKYSGYIAAAATSEAEQFDEYDVVKISQVFKKRPLLTIRRLVQVATTLGRWAALRYVDSQVGRSEFMFKKRAGQLRASLVQLGPAFVKIAQAVSSRPDVISPEYLEELALLQDRIAPFSTEYALKIIEEDLGVPVELLFSEISPQPIAAASLGQVYQARLRANGQAVAVKVQRPGVRAAISLDIYILRQLVGLARKVFRLNTDLQAIVDEWAASLFKEMDYHAEARNGLRFKKLFGSLPDVVVPEFYSALTSKRVLIMEWLEGQRLSEVSDLHLVEVGVNCSLAQLLDCGFYHADPHPGNLMRTPDGKLAYLDFGMMGEVKQELREGLIEAALHLINREFDALAGDFVTLGLLPPTNEVREISNALTGVFQNAVSKGVRNLSFGDLSGNLGVTMYRYKFRLPAFFSLVVRSLTVLEGIALSSDPNYKVLSSSYPWIARKVLTDSSPQLRNSLRTLLYKDGAFRIDRLESLVTEAMRNTLADPGAGSEAKNEESRQFAKKVLKFALSDQGLFVREILLDELTKGVDALNRALLDRTAQVLLSQLPISVPVPSQFTEKEDLEHLTNLRRLSFLLSGPSTGGSRSSEVRKRSDGSLIDDSKVVATEELSLLLESVNSSSKYLPLLALIPELPLNAQREALFLPAELAGRLTSRFLARTIRSTVPRAVSQTPTISTADLAQSFGIQSTDLSKER
ncbi:hypothetical protein R1flu_005998 [Riccia fluitans]|uniref:Protein kinase domain-containing protein n=1 Tax=Riccia fluitans TaxID=41844 RepID=A0ABD1YUS6_9MARC